MAIPEIEAKEILHIYEGYNNQLLEWKKKFETTKNFKGSYIRKLQKSLEVFPRSRKSLKQLPKIDLGQVGFGWY